MGEWFPKQRLGDLPERAARRWGPREALVFGGGRWSFAEVASRVERLARGLIAVGVEPGDKVALWMPNRPEWIDAMFAVWRIGAVLVPINTRLRTHDVAYILRQCDASTLILPERAGPVEFLAMLREALPELGGEPGRELSARDFPALRRVILWSEGAQPGTWPWSEVLAAGEVVVSTELARRARAVDPDAPAFLMYTSGTTGLPKGVVHGHAIVRNVVDRANRLAVTPADTILMYLPLYHIFGFGEGPLMSLLAGARQVLTETFEAAECVRLIEAERCSLLHGFDTHFQALADAQEAAPRDLSSIRTGLIASGMTGTIPVARRAQRVLGPLVSCYGMSEFGVGACLSFPTSSPEQRSEASGYPAPGYEVRVVNPETGRETPVGEPGEIRVRSYLTFQGYYRKPEETARTVDGEGWVHTGDMGVMRPDGHLRFMGRYKERLKIGGENVDPMEVEAYLCEHPQVQAAAVVGVPDRRLSEVAAAFVIPAPGPPPSPEALIEHCRGAIAGFKVPRHVFFVEGLPMTGSGKVQKVKLQAEARKRLGMDAGR